MDIKRFGRSGPKSGSSEGPDDSVVEKHCECEHAGQRVSQ